MSLLTHPTHDHAQLCLMWHPINRNAQTFTTILCIITATVYASPTDAAFIFQESFDSCSYVQRQDFLANIMPFGLHWHIYPIIARPFFALGYSSAHHNFVSFVVGWKMVTASLGVFRVWSYDEERQADDIVAHHVCIKIRPAGVNESRMTSPSKCSSPIRNAHCGALRTPS
jgi:hypothetical protein